jgi:hypothetical protein
MRYLRKHRLLLAMSLVTVVGLTGAAGAIAFTSANRQSRGAIDPSPAKNARVTVHDAQLVGGQNWQVNSFTNAEGQACLAVVVPGEEGGTGTNCDDPSSFFARGPIHYVVSSKSSASDRSHWEAVWVWGRVAPSVTRLELTTATCARTPVRVDSDGVFLHILTPALARSTASLPQGLVAYDATGSRVANDPVPLAATPAAQHSLNAPPTPPHCQ